MERRITTNPRSSGLTAVIIVAGIAVAGMLAALLYLGPNPLYAIVGLVGLFAVAGTLVKPELGLFLVAFLTYTRFSDVLVNVHHAPSVAKFLVPLLAGAVLVQWVITNRPPTGWERATVLVGSFVLVSSISLLYADNFERSWWAIEDFLKDAVIAILVAIILQRADTLRGTVWALLLAGIFLGTISVVQYLTGDYGNTYFGFSNAAEMQIVANQTGFRITGPFGSPNSYAQVMVVLVPLALDRLFAERSILLKGVAFWAFVATSLTVVYTFSRGGFIALAVVTILVIFWRRPPLPAFLLLAAVGMGLFFFAAPPEYLDRVGTLSGLVSSDDVSSQSDVSFRGRANEYTVALMMFRDNPIIGVGLDNYPEKYLEYSRLVGLDARYEQRSPHDLYLEIAAEQGLLGLLVFGTLLYVMFRGMWQAKNRLARAGMKALSNLITAIMIGTAGYFTSALFIHNSYPRPLWLLVGIALALPHLAKNELDIQRSKGNRTE
ncbi:MAG: O-antigen ligase family protein [Anaerolineaceae bacterium]|nr:O-antigen ligase family protein [Anaerolineaceae bacterium]